MPMLANTKTTMALTIAADVEVIKLNPSRNRMSTKEIRVATSKPDTRPINRAILRGELKFNP